jgi:hypothetical protein
MNLLFPAILVGTSLWARKKRTAGSVRWIRKTEEQVKRLPVGLALERHMEHGDALPQAPAGFRWKGIKMLVATSIFTAPEDMEVYVLEPMFNGGLNAFLTKQLVQRPTGLGSSYLTTQDVQVNPHLGYFLTTQGLRTAPVLGADLIY